MPRTAITLGLKHGRKESVLLFGRETHLLKQRDEFRKLKAPPLVHEEFCEVTYQESDSHEQIIRFRSPEEHAAFESDRKQRQKEIDEYAKKAAADLKKKRNELAKPPESDLREVKHSSGVNAPMPSAPPKSKGKAPLTKDQASPNPAQPEQKATPTEEKIPDAPEGKS